MTVQTDPMPGESTAWSGWNPEVLKQNNDCFEGRPPEELLRWGLETFVPDIALASTPGTGGRRPDASHFLDSN